MKNLDEMHRVVRQKRQLEEFLADHKIRSALKVEVSRSEYSYDVITLLGEDDLAEAITKIANTRLRECEQELRALGVRKDG